MKAVCTIRVKGALRDVEDVYEQVDTSGGDAP